MPSAATGSVSLAATVSLAVISALVAGCSDEGPSRRVPLAVYAASSLTDAFRELEALFELDHAEADVALSFSGSQVLRVQIQEGAPADVFASANPLHVEELVRGQLVSGVRVFAHNELVVIVPLDDPSGIESFLQLPRATRLVLGTADAPVGGYARRVLSRADSLVRPGFGSAVLDGLVSEESNVRLARSKVELGEADASLVYRTDALTSERVRTVAIPEDVNVSAEYLIGLVDRTGRSPLAEAWIELVLSERGQRVLGQHGFVVG